MATPRQPGAQQASGLILSLPRCALKSFCAQHSHRLSSTLADLFVVLNA